MATDKTPARAARPHSLYRAILSLAVAALIAASIPFAAIYISTVNRPPALSALTPSSGSAGSLKLVTTASGRQIAVPAGSVNGATAPVRTRTSAAGQND